MTIPTITRLRTTYEKDQAKTRRVFGSWCLCLVFAGVVLAVLG